MARHHLIRVGALAQVGRFTSVDSTRYPRGSRVVVRTGRGLELGEVLSPSGDDDAAPGDGSILRGVTMADELLEARLEQNRQKAYRACVKKLDQWQLQIALLDVEQLFDGRTLWFYFLGEVPPELEDYTAELAEAYEAKAQFRRFATAVTEGCGPGCGTEDAAGCKTCVSGCAQPMPARRSAKTVR